MLVVGLILGLWLWGGESNEQSDSAGVASQEIWTCSMHPQIRQNEPGQCPICGMDLIPLTQGKGNRESHDPMVYTMSPEAAALANVQTTPAVFEEPETEVFLTGKIAVDEQNLGTITAHYGGRIENLFVDYTGQRVRKGDKLATIYSPDLITAQKELLETAKSKASNSVLYQAAREKLRLWKITETQMAHLEETGEIVTEFDVYADLSGIVLRRNVTKGDHVARGSALFEIADLSTVWVLLDAYESDLSWIRLGSSVRFTVASLPGQEFVSKVTFIDPVINPQTRTASVRAEAQNPKLSLKPDMFVDARIISTLTEKDAALLIPKTAVLWTGTRSVVYVDVSKPDGPAFEMREVVLGPRTGDQYVVAKGLEAKEAVVTHGVFAVDAAAQLSGNFSMMNRPHGDKIALSDTFRNQLVKIGDLYFALKNALVQDNATSAQGLAKDIEKLLSKIDMKSLSEAEHAVWMVQAKAIQSAVSAIASVETIEGQRENFAELSDAFIELAGKFQFLENKVFVDFCPMVFGNQGALWLSESEEILNPYFGASMLRCGEVRQVLSPVQNQKNMSMPGHAHN